MKIEHNTKDAHGRKHLLPLVFSLELVQSQSLYSNSITLQPNPALSQSALIKTVLLTWPFTVFTLYRKKKRKKTPVLPFSFSRAILQSMFQLLQEACSSAHRDVPCSRSHTDALWLPVPYHPHWSQTGNGHTCCAGCQLSSLINRNQCGKALHQENKFRYLEIKNISFSLFAWKLVDPLNQQEVVSKTMENQ